MLHSVLYDGELDSVDPMALGVSLRSENKLIKDNDPTEDYYSLGESANDFLGKFYQ